MSEFCKVCGFPVDECICLDCCGHDCLLDQGMDFCPVCKPKPVKPEPGHEKDTDR